MAAVAMETKHLLPHLSGAFLRDHLTYKDETSQDCYPPWEVLILGLEIFNMAAVAMETKQEKNEKIKSAPKLLKLYRNIKWEKRNWISVSEFPKWPLLPWKQQKRRENWKCSKLVETLQEYYMLCGELDSSVKKFKMAAVAMEMRHLLLHFYGTFLRDSLT